MRSISKVIVIAVAGAAVAFGLTACSSSSDTTAAGASSSSLTGFIDANGIDITGVWTSGKRQFLSIDGVRGEGRETITISDLQDGLFMVKRDLEVPSNVAGNLGTGATTTHAILKGIGVVNPDGTLTILKDGDQGRITGWMRDANTIEAVYSEGGSIPPSPHEPVLVRYTLTRQTTSSPNS